RIRFGQLVKLIVRKVCLLISAGSEGAGDTHRGPGGEQRVAVVVGLIVLKQDFIHRFGSDHHGLARLDGIRFPAVEDFLRGKTEAAYAAFARARVVLEAENQSVVVVYGVVDTRIEGPVARGRRKRFVQRLRQERCGIQRLRIDQLRGIKVALLEIEKPGNLLPEWTTETSLQLAVVVVRHVSPD